MNVSRLDARARLLVLTSPADGSQDLYVSTMVGLPQRLIPDARTALRVLRQRTSVHGSSGRAQERKGI